ncbi:MAG: hypothetical protein HRT57_05715 [Crocinitomicaceae bacterium]|nr:hypothetical protein [Crocinitomicaceae bacterium]
MKSTGIGSHPEVKSAINEGSGVGSKVTVISSVPIHPFASVPITLYVSVTVGVNVTS